MTFGICCVFAHVGRHCRRQPEREVGADSGGPKKIKDITTALHRVGVRVLLLFRTTRIKNNPSLQLVLTRTPTPPQCKVEGVIDVWFSRWPFASTLYLGVWGSTPKGKLGLISRRVERGDVKKQPCTGDCFKSRTSNVEKTVSALKCRHLTMSNLI